MYFQTQVVRHLFAVDQQGEVVEQTVDGVSRLVDGQDDGATVVGHPEETGRQTLKFGCVDFNLGQLVGWKELLHSNDS